MASAAPTASGTTSAIPSSAAAGGITITRPVQTAAASYYKIHSGVDVTFGWNFTSVLRYPTSLTVQAYCSSNANTYPITVLPGTATQATWAPYEYSRTAAAAGQPALVEESYRLQIFDERGLNVGASPGLMSPNSQVTFALYVPQAYTPLSAGWTCSTCQSNFGLASGATNPFLMAVMVTFTVMFLSSFNILRRH